MAENEVNNPLATETISFDPRSTTDFEGREIEAPRDFSTVKKPVGKDPVLVQGLADIFSSVGDTLKKGKGDNVLAEFQNRQLTIVDALENGGIKTSREARLRLRRNLMEFNTNYPQYQKELITAHSKILGFSDVVDTGADEERRRTALVDDLINEGMISPDASENEIEAAIAHNQSRSSRIAALEARQKELSVMLSEENLSSAKRRRLEDEQKDTWRQFVKLEAPDQVKVMRNEFEKILKSDMSEADKEAQIADLMIGWRSSETIVQLRRVLGSEESEAFFKPFEMLEETYISRAKGELKDEEVERKLSRIESYNASILAAEPSVQKVMGAKKLFGDSAILPMIVENSGVMQSVYKIMTDNTTEAKSNPYDPKNKEGFEHLIKELPDLLERVEGDEELTSEMTEQINGLIQGAYDNEGHIRRDPLKARSIVEGLAQTKFYEQVVKSGEFIDGEIASEAREVLKIHYNDEVMGMVKREFQEGNIYSPEEVERARESGGLGVHKETDFRTGKLISGGTVVNESQPREIVADAVTYDITNNIIEFRAIDPENRGAMDKARTLNKTLAPVIRNMVRADAHLSGHNNYQQVWESYADQVLSPDFLGQPGGGDGGDDLNIEDFRIEVENPISDEEIDTSLLNTGEGRGFTHGRKMDNVEGMIIHHTGGRGNASDIVRILDERGLSVQFVIDRDGKVHQLMEDNDVAFHAGKNNDSGFDNKNTLGVEIIAKEDSDVLPIQVEAAQRLITAMSQKHGFKINNVFGHGELATHKQPTEGAKVLSKVRGD